MFPAVEQPPQPRADTPMDANQVQQATEDLITDRNRLSAEAQGTSQPAADPAAAPKKLPVAAGSGSAQSAVGSTPQNAAGETQ